MKPSFPLCARKVGHPSRVHPHLVGWVCVLRWPYNEYMSCHVIWVHLHQLVVESITLLHSLAKFHHFQVLRLDPIEVCQF
jgi:hypothetical protein